MGGAVPAKDAELKATGRLRVSTSLAGADKAVSLRPRDGGPQVTDGPFEMHPIGMYREHA